MRHLPTELWTGIQTTVPCNLLSAFKNLEKAGTDVEQLKALCAITEEFYRTIGILFYTRYSTIQAEKTSFMDTEIQSLIDNEFKRPTHESWLKLGKLCSKCLQGLGDDITRRYAELVHHVLEPDFQSKTQKVLVLLEKWSPASVKYESEQITIPVFLQTLLRILDYSKSRMVTSVTPRELLQTGFAETAPEVISLILTEIGFKIIVPISFSKKATRIEILTQEEPEIRELPPVSEYLRYLYTCYIQFEDSDDPFRYRTELLHYDRSDHNYYVYSRLEEDAAVYSSLDDQLRVDSRRREGVTLVDIFGHVSSISDESLYPTLSKRFGAFSIDNEVVHNMKPKLDEYVRRPEAEEELKSMLSRKKFYTTTLDGGGGFGKSELAKFVIWQIIEAPKDELPPQLRFSRIIWTTGQKEYFRGGRIETEKESLVKVEDVLDSILYLTNNFNAIREEYSTKRKLVIDALNQAGSVLIVLDNLETVAEKELIWNCLRDFIDEAKANVRVLSTSRIKRSSGEDVVTIGPMEYPEARELTLYWMNYLRLEPEFQNEEFVRTIVDSTGSIPLLIRHMVFLLKNGQDLDMMIQLMPPSSDEALEFMFGLQWNGLTDNAKKLLTGVAYSGGLLHFRDAKNLCSLSDDVFKTSVDDLDDRSFIVSRSLEKEALETLPPITLFALSKLQMNQELELEFIGKENLIRTPILPTKAAWTVNTRDSVVINEIIQRAALEAQQGAVYLAYGRLQKASERFSNDSEIWRKKGEFEYRFLKDPKTARESFYRATLAAPTDPLTYEMWGLLEYEHGIYRRDEASLQRSIRQYEQAMKLASMGFEQKRLGSLIGLVTTRLADLITDVMIRAKRSKAQELEAERNKYYRRAIDILERNTGTSDKSPEEKFVEVRILSLLSWCYLSIGASNDESRNALDDCALARLLQALKIQFDSPQLQSTLLHHGVRRTLRRYGKAIRRNEKLKQIRSAVIQIEDKLHCDQRLVGRALSTRK